MTRNQIEYWALEENKRSNRANEVERKRNNINVEGETKRSNLARELETNRHNLATERQAVRENLTTARKYQNEYFLGLQGQNEAIRANKARETENTRSAQARERENTLSRYADTSIRRRAASTADYNAYTSRLNLDENVRSNMARESIQLGSLAELGRSNLAREAETNRSNIVKESQTNRDLARRESELIERRRSNLASENITMRGQNLQLVGTLANAASRQITGVTKKGALK